ncbi:unnamed protein product, partial [Ranitomeya imitator]
MTYDLRCQCDAFRVTKTVRPYSITCNPINENAVALIISDGRVMIWELKSSSVPGRKIRSASGSSACTLYAPLSFCGKPVGLQQKKCPDLSLDSMIAGQSLSESPQSASSQEVSLKFLLTGLLSGLPQPPFVVRMCPPLTTKNITQYKPLLAVGTSNGSVFVYNLTSGLLHKELNIHSCEVRGIEWISLTSFLSFATSTPNNSGLVRNELQLVDLLTGSPVSSHSPKTYNTPVLVQCWSFSVNVLQSPDSLVSVGEAGRATNSSHSNKGLSLGENGYKNKEK